MQCRQHVLLWQARVQQAATPSSAGTSHLGFFEAHQVDYECCRADEEDFHRCVVDGDEVHEEVEVADAEN